MSIISWNIEGLKSCCDDDDYLNFVQNFDIVFLSETWQRSENEFRLHGYECFDVPRPESINGSSRRGHGGVCLFVNQNILNGVTVLEKHDSGIICIKLCKTFFNLLSDIFICFLYIPTI